MVKNSNHPDGLISIANCYLLQLYYKIVTILLYLAKTNKNKEDNTVCYIFINSCSELFNNLCNFIKFGC